MKFPAAVTLVLIARLAVATLVAAQGANEEVPPDPIPPRVEIGFVGGLDLVVPIAGLRLSVPIGRGLAAEGLVAAAPWVARDSADAWLATQWQVRVPFRQNQPGARRHVLLGVSTVSVLDRFFAGGASPRRLRPHVGSSWQWRRRRGMDLRVDVGVMTDVRRPSPIPYANVAAVFRTGPG